MNQARALESLLRDLKDNQLLVSSDPVAEEIHRLTPDFFVTEGLTNALHHSVKAMQLSALRLNGFAQSAAFAATYPLLNMETAKQMRGDVLSTLSKTAEEAHEYVLTEVIEPLVRFLSPRLNASERYVDFVVRRSGKINSFYTGPYPYLQNEEVIYNLSNGLMKRLLRKSGWGPHQQHQMLLNESVAESSIVTDKAMPDVEQGLHEIRIECGRNARVWYDPSFEFNMKSCFHPSFGCQPEQGTTSPDYFLLLQRTKTSASPGEDRGLPHKLAREMSKGYAKGRTTVRPFFDLFAARGVVPFRYLVPIRDYLAHSGIFENMKLEVEPHPQVIYDEEAHVRKVSSAIRHAQSYDSLMGLFADEDFLKLYLGSAASFVDLSLADLDDPLDSFLAYLPLHNEGTFIYPRVKVTGTIKLHSGRRVPYEIEFLDPLSMEMYYAGYLDHSTYDIRRAAESGLSSTDNPYQVLTGFHQSLLEMMFVPSHVENLASREAYRKEIILIDQLKKDFSQYADVSPLADDSRRVAEFLSCQQ